MGKKKDDYKNSEAYIQQRWENGVWTKEEVDALHRYGFEDFRDEYRGPEKAGLTADEDDSYGQLRKDFLRRVGNDYDTRRTIEASGLAGDEKATKMAKQGIGNVNQAMAANDYLMNLHKKNGNGGDFSSASDFAGVTHKAVQDDRNKLQTSFSDRLDAMKPSVSKTSAPTKTKYSYNDYRNNDEGAQRFLSDKIADVKGKYELDLDGM